MTPMQRQYQRIKRKHPDCLIMFRVGDFFELFGADAKLGAKILGITLTSRGDEPLAGVPVKAADAYMATLVKHGYKVAVVDQLEDANEAKGLVKRGVIRILTPGTITETSMLNSCENNYIISIHIPDKENIGLAIADVSTGEFRITEFTDDKSLDDLIIELSRISPAECIHSEEISLPNKVTNVLEGVLFTQVDPFSFSQDDAYKLLTNHFETTTLEGFGCENKPYAIAAGGALLEYLRETQRTKLANIRSMALYSTKGCMIIDPTSFRSLELLKNIRDNTSQGTLIEILDQSCTSMGGRFIRRLIRRPLTDSKKINNQLDAVEELVNNSFAREDLREKMSSIQDLERLASQISLKRANARDLISIKTSLKIIPSLKNILKELSSKQLISLGEELLDLSSLVTKIEKALKDSPAANLKEGGIIKDGYNERLDELRGISEDGRKWIIQYELEQKTQTGIKSLRVEFNNVLGYYIQVGKKYTKLVPDSYTPKQEVKSGKRYITSELKEYEAKLLKAKDQIHELEYELFCELREEVHSEITKILKNAEKIARLDCLTTFADVARVNDYKRPHVNNSLEISIKQGRHPVVEKLLVDKPFIPNDAYLHNETDQLLIITGPNMSGKSTYIRQVAIIVIMAQMGCFVPAQEAIIGVVDRVFTRIGASDDISKGLSTFLVEMNETANILNNATERSLIILDEIGRGTSTFDGVSIAWAVAEYIHNANRLGSKTLFATHYHQLIDLNQYLPRVKNYSIRVKKKEDEIVFLYKIEEGGTDKSYGIQVAKLSGMPDAVISRAKEILAFLEIQSSFVKGDAETSEVVQKQAKSIQTNLFGQVANPRALKNINLTKNLFDRSKRKEKDRINDEIVEDLRNLDVNHCTPLEALNKLNAIKERIEKSYLHLDQE